MTHIIVSPCIGLKDGSCIDVCPVDCIYTTDDDKQMFIAPDECIDCGACIPACPVKRHLPGGPRPRRREGVPGDQRPVLRGQGYGLPQTGHKDSKAEHRIGTARMRCAILATRRVGRGAAVWQLFRDKTERGFPNP